MHPFTTFEKLIQSPGTQDTLLATLTAERSSILNTFQTIFLTPPTQQEQQIPLLQYQLLELMESISNTLPYEAFITPQENNNLLTIYNTLFDLLGYLEKSCPQYLDFHRKVPLIYLVSARQMAHKQLPEIRQVLSERDTNDLLTEIILSPIEELVHTINISYQRLHYIKELSDKLLGLPPAIPVDELLCYMNYNNHIYIKYKINELKANIYEHPTLHQQLQQTKWLLKLNNQQLQHPQFQYTPLHPAIREQIRDWLTEESIYLEHQLQYPDTTPPPEEIARWMAFKLRLNIPVPDLACLLRIMIECGLILNENKTEVAEFAARFFATSKREEISASSLRHKMYTCPPSAVASVKDILMTLYNHTRAI
jgi:hypothetical protein